MRMLLILWILFYVADVNAKKVVTTSELKKRIQNIQSRPQKAPQDYLDLAKTQLLLKDYESALESAKKGNSPQSLEGLDLIAKICHEKKDFLEEVRALEIMKAIGKRPPGFYVRLAAAYEELGKADEVIKNLRDAQMQAPKYQKGFTALYDYHYKKNNFYEARLLLLDIIEKFGAKPQWLNELCKMEIKEKFFDSAKTICQSALVESPDVPDNHVYLALAFKATEAEDQSRKILFSAAKRFKNSELAQTEAGRASQAIQNFELSEVHFGQCAKLNPKSGECHLELAQAQFSLKKYEVALKSFMKACPYLKEAELEIRKRAYDLDKLNQKKLYKSYIDSTEKCQSVWFAEAKKTR